MDANLFEKANRIIKKCDAVYLGVIDENGYPNVSTVTPLKAEDIFVLHFAAGVNSNKTKRLRADKKASVCCRLEGDNVTLVGEAEILCDSETRSRFWLDWFINHFPAGKDDPNYCIIKFTTKRVSLWIKNESAEFTVEELLKVQSRCGLLCTWCEYRQSCGCEGCVETDGNPFHGKCHVAQCCLERGYSHCGECENLPGECADTECKKTDANGFFECEGCKNTSCDKLYPYSYKDPEYGDDPPGARIAVCRAWANRRGS